MHPLEQLRQAKLKETEEHLIQLGLVKCLGCGYWQPKDEVCNHTGE